MPLRLGDAKDLRLPTNDGRKGPSSSAASGRHRFIGVALLIFSSKRYGIRFGIDKDCRGFEKKAPRRSSKETAFARRRRPPPAFAWG